MDKQFDERSKSLAEGISRREAIQKLGIGLACVLLAVLVMTAGQAARGQGYLLVSSLNTNSVLRYNETTGAFVDAFVPRKSGGLIQPYGILFGPDGKNDGKQDLYVASASIYFKNGLKAVPGTSTILRYDGTTGAFNRVFVSADSGGLQFPSFMTFTETNPTTLNYQP